MGMGFCQPPDEFPVAGREQLLLVRGARGQFQDFAQRPDLLAGARARQAQFHRQPAARGLLRVGLRMADRPHKGPRRVEVRRGLREKPGLQVADQLLLPRRLLEALEPVAVGVDTQFRGHRPPRAQKQERQLLQALRPLHRQQARPPVGVGEILARQAELFEVILEQEPRPLRIRAAGEDPQQFLPFGDHRA